MNTQIIIGCTIIAIGALVILTPRRVVNAIAHPGYGCCYKCERTWDVVSGHTTYVGQIPIRVKFGDGEWEEKTTASGCFPLCEECWADLKTPEARLPYYRRLVDDWAKFDRLRDTPSEQRWPAIRDAVMAGG